MALEDFPRWFNPALQGITYWIGHRRCVYRRYPLAEAALVAELCNLIFTHLSPEFVLQCEVMYSSLLVGKEMPLLLTQRARADLRTARVAHRSPSLSSKLNGLARQKRR
jgi:hypothetical protein